MASITKRGQRWLVQIRRKGEQPQSRTFSVQADARAWATAEESRIDRAEPAAPRKLLEATTLGQLVERYRAEITPYKRSAVTETARLKQLARDALACRDLATLNSTDISAFRDRRLQAVKPGTVRRDLALLSHIFEVARKEWGFRTASNPVKDIRQPALQNARSRRLDPGEYQALLYAASKSRNPYVALIIRFAIETGLRRGELVDLSWSCVDLAQRIAQIPVTKTGRPRAIPLTDEAVAILRVMSRKCSDDRVFPVTANASKLSWQRIVKRAGLQDLRFHDLRHEAVSRFFELGLSLTEVALISGHRDPRMLFRYTHLRPESLVEKLRGRAWSEETVGRFRKPEAAA